MAAEPGVQRAAVATAQVWHSRFGDMLIETCVDGTVWINGEPVASQRSQPVEGETLSPQTSAQPEDKAGERPDAAAQDQPYDYQALIQAAEDKAFFWLWPVGLALGAAGAGLLRRHPGQGPGGAPPAYREGLAGARLRAGLRLTRSGARLLQPNRH